jgi:hypothetical protein
MPARLTVLGVALTTGLAGDILLRSSPWGIGFSIWVVLVSAAVVVILRTEPRETGPGVATFLAAAVLFGACLGLRDSPHLRAWNVLGVLIALGMALLAGRGLPLATSAITRYVSTAVSALVATITAPMAIGTGTTRAIGHDTARLTWRVLLGTLVTIPLLLLFGALLTSADPVFGHLVRTAFGIDIGKVVSHIVVITVLTWGVAGYALAVLTRRGVSILSGSLRAPALGLVEIGTPMVALTILFAAFIGVQARYLFGGEALVRATVGLSFAEYARRGFFELVTASGLMIPVVVGADLLLSNAGARAVRWFRVIAGTQLLFLVLIMVSALERLRLYYQAYGLTVERLLAAVVMLWIGFTLGWFAVTVLRGQRARFPIGVVVSGLLVLAAVDAANPEAVVARVNVRRAVADAELDVAYLARLSGDAVPTLVEHAKLLPPGSRAALLSALSQRRALVELRDWRGWNLGYSLAQRELASLTPGEIDAARE